MSEKEFVCDPIILSETKRVTVYPDYYPMNAREFDEAGVSMFPIETNDEFDTLLPGEDQEMIGLLSDVFADGDWDNDNDDKVRAAKDVFNKHNRVWVEKQFNCHRDWVGNYFVWTTDDENAKEFLAGYCEMIQEWIDGYVYVVALEELHTYVDQADPERVFTRWETTDSIGDVYFDKFDEESILEVAGIVKTMEEEK